MVPVVLEEGGIDGNLAIEGKEHDDISRANLSDQRGTRGLPTELAGCISGVLGDETKPLAIEPVHSVAGVSEYPLLVEAALNVLSYDRTSTYCSSSHFVLPCPSSLLSFFSL